MSGCGCDGSNLHPVDEVIEHLLSRKPGQFSPDIGQRLRAVLRHCRKGQQRKHQISGW